MPDKAENFFYSLFISSKTTPETIRAEPEIKKNKKKKPGAGKHFVSQGLWLNQYKWIGLFYCSIHTHTHTDDNCYPHAEGLCDRLEQMIHMLCMDENDSSSRLWSVVDSMTALSLWHDTVLYYYPLENTPVINTGPLVVTSGWEAPSTQQSCQGQDLNRQPSDYKAKPLTAQRTRWWFCT